MQNVSTFLMFAGNAEEAINFYTSIIPDARIITLKKYGPGEGGKEGSVMHATFSIGSQMFACIDSSIEHGFGFTPAISIFITCSSEAEVDNLFSNLSEGGSVMMPLGAYPFSKKYAWLADKFGVSWQISFNG